MAADQVPTFGDLLKRYRVAAGLSQEALAERARLSARAISDLERGLKLTPRRDTVALLIQALDLSAEEGAALEATVSRRHGLRAAAMVAPPPAGEGAVKRSADRTHEPPAAGAPSSGILTFLLTDIEGSSALWERHPAAMRAALARHDALVDEVLTRHGGRQIRARGEGDSIFGVFTSPSAALAAACALQQALQVELWPAETPLRVRMGLHSGEVELREDGYYGVPANRAARIRSLAHGGQILLSQSTANLTRAALPAGASLRALGRHPLNGLAESEEVYQLCHPTLPAEFPPLLSPAAPRHNLPRQVDSFVGREQEQEKVRALLDRSPLVTLTGTGGVGKTRLALAVAAAAVDTYPDGVWLVELASLVDPSLVAQAVATVLGVREEPGRPLLATLEAHVRPRALLLVLDNCEHLISACAELSAALLRHCPGLRLLATSREAMAVAGETRFRVPALGVPDLARLPRPEQLSAIEAVDLFLQRAQSRRPDFALTAQNAPAVAQICARLDGLPLAIELAAARVGSMPVETIAARLDDRFRLLTGGSRTALPRHQTLHAAMDWNHDLLSAAEQALLRRLAVFAGGWTLGAAEAVCAGAGLASWEVLDLLAGLVNKSLVLLEERDGEARYRLLETVRQYGQEWLEATGEAAAVQEGHLAWYLALAEEAQPQLRGPKQVLWLARLKAEHDNLCEALGWCLREGGDAALGLRLAGALWRFWYTRGYLGEGQGWLERALASDQGMPAPRATALNGAAALAISKGEYGRAAPLYEEALALWRALGDTRGVAESLGNLGNVMVHEGKYGQAAALHEEALALFRSLGHEEGVAQNLANLGAEAYMQGEYGRAAALHEEALSLRRTMGDSSGIANSVTYLGLVAYMQGEYGRAGALYEEALALRSTLGDRRGIAGGLLGLGNVSYMQGDYRRAAALYEESLLLSRDIGARDLVAGSLESLAWVAAARGQSQVAARLGGAAAALREVLGAPLWPDDWAGHDQAVRTMRTALGEEAFAAVWAEGRALPLEQAIALAQEHGEVTVLRSDAAATT
ncbi:MAG: tetratricopeptide repeat protein [Chloroflexi bacterium]|nr:tetratricopeptide repeat protein [Chloroflexota bacterium]